MMQPTVAHQRTRARSRGTNAAQKASDIKLSNLLWLLLFNLLFFMPWIQVAFAFSYSDEATTLLLLVLAVISIGRRRNGSLNKFGRFAIAAMLLLVAIGLSCNTHWGIQNQQAAIAIDLFTCLKFPIALLSGYIVFKDNCGLFNLVLVEAKALILVMFTCALINLFLDIGMGTIARYGFRASFEFVFSHPTAVVAVSVGLLCILCCHSRANRFWIALTLLVIMATLRSKGFVFAAIAIFLILTFGKQGKVKPVHVGFGLAAALFLGYDQFMSYFVLHDGYARRELMRASFEVASQYFPLGGGFATFGSAATAGIDAYSPLYYYYGLSTVHGLTPGETSFLSDTFWPTVIGQFGWLGLTIYVALLICLFKQVYDNASAGKLSAVLCFAYLLISSTAESAFFHPMSIYLACCLAISLSQGAQQYSIRLKRTPNATKQPARQPECTTRDVNGY